MANRAAYVEKEKQVPFVVREAPTPQPGPDEIIIKNHAIAINPVDWVVQRNALFPLKYPLVLGEDSAGVVQSVGSAVTAFKPGDRVIAHGRGLGSGDNADGTFQLLVRASTQLAAKIPDGLDFPSAVVLPLAASTAAHGLYASDYLALPLPSLAPKPAGKSVLIYGGSTSVGATAIQFAKASGLEVVTTASAHNFAFVKGLGADFVVDHKSSTAVDEIVDFLKGKTVAGAYSAHAAGASVEKCAEVLARTQGSKFVAATLPPPEKLADGVSGKMIQALAIQNTPVAKGVWGEYLPQALAQGKLKAEPQAQIIGSGLEKVQEGCDLNMKGVSASKVVITL